VNWAGFLRKQSLPNLQDYRGLPGTQENNNKKKSQDNGCPGWDSKLAQIIRFIIWANSLSAHQLIIHIEVDNNKGLVCDDGILT
jgi:hypothetical protein